MTAPIRRLRDPVRDRHEAALDKLIDAARELLACVDLADDIGSGGVPESRHDAAKAAARRAIADAETLRGAR